MKNIKKQQKFTKYKVPEPNAAWQKNCEASQNKLKTDTF